MTIHQRKPGGPWHIYLPPVHPGGKPLRVSTGLTDRKAAQKMHDELAVDRARERQGLAPVAAPRSGGMTLAEAHRFVMRNHWSRLKSPESAQTGFDTWARLVGPDRPIRTLTQGDVRRAVEALTGEEGLSPATVNRKLAYLSKLLRYVALHADEPGVPSLRFPHLPVAPFRPFIFSPEDEQRMLDWFADVEADWMTALCTVLVDTGMRLGEALRVRPEHFRDGGDVLEVWENKASHPRTIPLTARARRCFSVWNWGFAGFKESDVERIWKRMRAEVFPNVDGRCSPHSLRHTCCTRLFRAGMDAARVQRWMGHKDISTTMLYAHVDASDLEGARDALERVHSVRSPEGSGSCPAAYFLVGGARFELATNGLKVRPEDEPEQ